MNGAKKMKAHNVVSSPILEQKELHIASGCCSSPCTEVAVKQAYDMIIGQLQDLVPTLILVAFTCSHDADEVIQHLHELCPSALVAGQTSCRGAISDDRWISFRGRFALCLWAIHDPQGEYAVTRISEECRKNVSMDWFQRVLDECRKIAYMRPDPASFVLIFGGPGVEEVGTAQYYACHRVSDFSYFNRSMPVPLYPSL